MCLKVGSISQSDIVGDRVDTSLDRDEIEYVKAERVTVRVCFERRMDDCVKRKVEDLVYKMDEFGFGF